MCTRVSLAMAVLTVSDTRTSKDDVSGAYLTEALCAAGHSLAARCVVPDDRYAIRAVVSAWIADPSVHVVLTTGGTGLTGRDVTPEALSPLLDKRLDGFGELFRMLSWEHIAAATMQSRCLAGTANATYVFCLPGSPAAVRLAWERILGPQLDSLTLPCNLAALRPRLEA